MNKTVKERINKRKIAYVYLLHRMFNANPEEMQKIMRIPEVNADDIAEWNAEFKDAVIATIEEENEKGVILEHKEELPSISAIKERVLRRCYDIIETTTDPSKLATVYKTLSEFESVEEKKTVSVLDVINESLKPLGAKPSKEKTLIEKMKAETALAKFGINPGKDDDDPPAEDATE